MTTTINNNYCKQLLQTTITTTTITNNYYKQQLLHQLTTITNNYYRYRCLSCSYLLDPFQVENVTGSKLPQPTSCPQCQGSNFRLDFDHTLYRNYQKITLQESPGKVPAGRVPRRKDVIVGKNKDWIFNKSQYCLT